MARYHITAKGDAALCRATKKPCPLTTVVGEPAPHYSTAEEAKEAYEKEQGELVKTLSKTSHSPYTPVLHTFGQGKLRVVKDAKGTRWNSAYQVTARTATGFPPFKLGDSEQAVKKAEEIAVNGEVVGYVLTFAPAYQGEGYSYVAKTVEEMNDPESFTLDTGLSRLLAVSDLVTRHEEAQKPLTLTTEADFGDIYRHNPTITTLPSGDQLYSEREERGGVVSRHTFLVHEGRPVAFMKTMEEPLPSGEKVRTLCDLETRYSERGKGYSKLMKEVMAEELGGPLRSTGSFTELGLKAYRGPALATFAYEGAPLQEPTASISPMNFVRNWDKLQPYFNL